MSYTRVAFAGILQSPADIGEQRNKYWDAEDNAGSSETFPVLRCRLSTKKLCLGKSHKTNLPEKQPAGSGPYAKCGGIWSLRFPPIGNGKMT